MDRLDGVRAQFGDPLPDGLDALSDDELADLASALTEAHREQSRAVDAAIDRALGHLPWLLRKPVRLILLEGAARRGTAQASSQFDTYMGLNCELAALALFSRGFGE
jgi:hypothetical protein